MTIDDEDSDYDEEPIDEDDLPEKKQQKERKFAIDANLPNKKTTQEARKIRNLPTDKKRRKGKESKLSNLDSKTSCDFTVTITVEQPQE